MTTSTKHDASSTEASSNENVDIEKAKEEWRRRREERKRQRQLLEAEVSSSSSSRTTAGFAFEETRDMDEDRENVGFTETAAKRRRREQESVLQRQIHSSGGAEDRRTVYRRAAAALAGGGGGKPSSSSSSSSSSQRDRNQTAKDGTEPSESSEFGGEGQNHHDDDAAAAAAAAAADDKGEGSDETDQVEKAEMSLLDQADALQKSLTDEQRKELQRKEEEARILREASKVQTNALQAASEVAKGVLYTKPMPSTWTAPRYILQQGPEVWEKIRQEWHMEVEGHHVPPPMKRFKDMKFPPPIVEALQEKKITRPTPIQMQGLPVALAGRDMVGIAFTGSGKTITFSLPLVMVALEEELRMPLVPGEGPIGFILAPSRELARQTFDQVHKFCERISNTPEYPRLRSQLLIGGESSRDQMQPIQQAGVHCIVATPGRMRDLLKKRLITLDNCRYCCLDEADRMLDLGFDEEVGEIMNYFPHQRQTLLFSATFPKKFQDFARSTLVQPVVVNVGRAGAANLDVIQEVEYVKQEAKIVYLLHCLQKTAPPVIIFCERKGDVDDIHEYLLLKGVEAVSIHGGKDQEERNEAIQLFKQGQKDVLVSSDVAAKGLDFADIQHVINFDMPSEIENYVHRIGRTGRSGKTGVATTFINKSCDEMTLLDLKHLLKEARQRIPPVLQMLEDPREAAEAAGGCSFCGGLGHTVVDCPKIDKDARRVASGHKDALATGGGYGGDW